MNVQLCRRDSDSASLLSFQSQSDWTPSFQDLRLQETFESSFMVFLAVAQTLCIDFLPISSSAARDAVGVGSTAEILQSVVNVQASLAFKKMRWTSHNEVEYMHILTKEIMILGFNAFRHHANIITLEGICWNVYAHGRIHPILVFEKSPFGDLKQFMTEGDGRELVFKDRLDLCSSIGATILDLHQGHVIHGDIKPENTLIFRNHDTGKFIPKIADFGYSTPIVPHPGQVVRMPSSKPWAAPEHHHRGFEQLQVFRMDIYSFGMLCLWLLFYNAEHSPDRDFAHDVNSDTCQSALEHSHQLLTTTREFDDVDKALLKKLFDLCLTLDADQRAQTMVPVMALLLPDLSSALEPFDGKRTETNQNEKPPAPVFQVRSHFILIANALAQLSELDYLVRSQIFQCLRTLVPTTINHVCSLFDLEICYQMAFCYRVGFGTAKNDQESETWLAWSQRSHECFEALIQGLISGIPPCPKSLTYQPHTSFSKWYLQGHITYLHRAQYYRKQNRLEEAEAVLAREIDDWESVLGSQHFIVVSTLSILALLMLDTGHWSRCQALAQRALGPGFLEEGDDFFSDENPQAATPVSSAINLLAVSYMRQGNFKKAETLQAAILRRNERDLGRTHLKTLGSTGILADIYSAQGRFKKAVSLLGGLQQSISRTLGDDHPMTIRTMLTLCQTYIDQKEFSTAEDLCVQVVDRANRVLGSEDEQTVIAEIQLARIRLSQRKWFNLLGPRKDADPKYQLIEKCQILLGEEHPYTLDIMYNTARSLFYKRRAEEATALMVKVVERATRRVGQNAMETVYYRRKLDFLQGWHRGEELGFSLMTFDLGRYVISTRYHPPPTLRRIFWILFRKETTE